MKIFIVLKQNGLLFFSKNNTPQELLFPVEAITHQEIVDQKLFEKFLHDAFANSSKQELIIFLSNELLFSKSFPLTKETTVDDELRKFADIVPLSSLTIEKKVIQTKQAIFCFATNGDLYKTIVAIAREKNCTIKKVVPLVLFGQTPEQSLTFSVLSRFAKEKEIMKKGDFLQKVKQPTEKKKIPLKQIFSLIICFLILVAVILWTVSMQK